MKKRGQITIFIIIGIIVVGLAVLIYMFYPEISTGLGFGAKNPQAYLQNCLEDDVVNAIEVLSSQGGKINPEHYILYNDEKIEYLCYTSEYHELCTVQQPMLKNSIENEIELAINDKVKECFEKLEKNFGSEGYGVNLQDGGVDVELLPKRVIVGFDSALTLTKDGTQTYDSIEVVVNNNLYELVSIANSIIGWETNYGDSETTTYMNYYHDLKVEKKKQSDGTTIYILTDRNNGNKFQFASRSLAWPPGYGVGNVVMTSMIIEG